MAVNVTLIDPKTGMAAGVTEFGQLIVSPIAFSSVVQANMVIANQAYNLLTPTARQQIVVTDIILTANRNVGVNDATVDLYLADGPDELAFSPADAVVALDLEKNGKIVLNSLNLITAPGKWINVKTDDTEVSVTLLYYRVPVE